MIDRYPPEPPQKPLEIRPYTDEDYEDLKALLSPEGMFYVDGRDNPLRLQRLMGRFGIVLLGTVDEAVIASAYVDTNMFPMVSGVAVDPSHRGHGYGERMMDAVKDRLIRQGMTSIELLVERDEAREPLMRWYEGQDIPRAYECVGFEGELQGATERRIEMVCQAIMAVHDRDCGSYGDMRTITDLGDFNTVFKDIPVPSLQSLQIAHNMGNQARESVTVSHDDKFQSWTAIPVTDSSIRLLRINVNEPGEYVDPHQPSSIDGWYVAHDERTGGVYAFGIIRDYETRECTVEFDERVLDYFYSAILAQEDELIKAELLRRLSIVH